MGQYLELADEVLEGVKASRTSHASPYDINDINDQSHPTRPFNQDDMEDIKAGKVVHVWSDLLGEWLIWVQGERERRILKTKGIKAPIYTLGELALVAKMEPAEIKTLHRFKQEFSATIQPVERTNGKTTD